MTTTMEQSTTSTGEKGPKDHTLAYMSYLVERAELAKRAGNQFDGERSLPKVLGYKTGLEFKDFLAKYDRQDVAGRIVDMPAKETWKGQIWVTDAEDDAETPFVKDWLELTRRLRVWHHFGRVDRLAGIGRYAVLLVGLKDGKELEEPAERVQGPQDVLYLTPYREDHAEIVEWDTDTQSPRFGRPEMYELTIAGSHAGFRLEGRVSDKVKVHHSRILHVAEGLLEDEVFGRPRLQRVFDRLDDLQKLAGGSAEIFWLVAAQLLHIDIDKDADIKQSDLDALDEQVQEVMHNLRRTLQTQGATAQAIGGDGSKVAPEQTYNMLSELIGAAAEIPHRILFGSERGELASTQDQEEWHNRVQGRREEHGEPALIRPFIERLVDLGAIKPPKDGQFRVEWPQLGEPSAAELAETGKAAAEAASFLSPGDPTLVLPIHEFREWFFKLSPVPPEAPKGMPTPQAAPATNRAGRRSRGKVDNASDPRMLIRRIAHRLEPGLRAAFLEAVEKIRGRIDLGALEAALASRDVAAAEAALLLGELDAEFGEAAKSVIRQAVREGGDAAAGAMATQLGVTLRFNLTNSQAIAWIEAHTAELVVQVGGETREAIRRFIRESFAQGITPQETAQRIYGVIGLTERQQGQVRRFRIRLEEEEGITGAKLDRRVSRYVEAQLRRRSRTIARHESFTAASEGQRALWKQASDVGLVRFKDPDQRFLTGDGSRIAGPPAHVQCRCGQVLTFLEDGTAWKVWIVTPDERLCPICEPIPHMEANQPPEV